MSRLLVVLIPLLALPAVAAPETKPTVRSEAQIKRDAALAPRIKALLDVHTNFRGVLSPDGKKFLFGSDRGGVPELFLSDVAQPAAPAKKLVSGPERVSSAVFTRDGKSILFRRDHGADENYHIFRIDVDGKGLVDLTPGEPFWRDTPLLPSQTPDTMVYSARKPKDYKSRIFVQALAGGVATLVYEHPSVGGAIDVSADGTHVLFMREASTGGHDLFEIDLRAHTERPLSSRDGKPERVTTAAYSTDGKRVYVGSDRGGESHFLTALDLKTLAPVAQYRQSSPPTADVEAAIPSPTGDRVAISIDAGNHSELRVLDATTLAVRLDVKTPLGTASLGVHTETRIPLAATTFSADGKHFVIGLSLPDAPDDLYLVDAASGAMTPLRQELRAGLAGLPAITASIEYVPAFDGQKIPINVYLPKERTKTLATIVSFHGGPDASTAVGWGSWTRVYAAHGYAVIEANIRGSTGFGRAWAMGDDKEKRLDAMADVASINAWVRQQRWCDPKRVIVDGASFGGYIVLMALTRQPKLWAAGVDLVGVSDLTTLLMAGSSPQRYIAEFGDPNKDAALIRSLSPIYDADKIVAPLFIYQGQNDSRVPRAQSDAMVRALRQRRVPVEYMVAMNEGHSVSHQENEIEFLSRSLRFLEETLGAR